MVRPPAQAHVTISHAGTVLSGREASAMVDKKSSKSSCPLVVRSVADGDPRHSPLPRVPAPRLSTSINQQFQRRAAAVGENEQCSQQRILAQLLMAQSDQSIYAFPKIDSINGEHNAL